MMDDARSRSIGIPTLRVRTSCEHTVALVERYARDISPSGVFVRTRDTLPLGAMVRFEYLLADGRCALAGDGRVAFRRTEAEVGAASVGVGIAFERLRQGDRAVVERMNAARAGVPSRFERPGTSSVPPRSPLRADALFADVKIASADAAESMAAYLSADLTTDLPTVRPPSSMPAPTSAPAARLEGPLGWSGDLADRLEPTRASALDSVDADATPAFVPLEARPAMQTRATDSEREARLHELMANAARDESPSARRRVWPLLVVLVVLALIGLALLGLPPWRGSLDPWLHR